MHRFKVGDEVMVCSDAQKSWKGTIRVVCRMFGDDEDSIIETYDVLPFDGGRLQNVREEHLLFLRKTI